MRNEAEFSLPNPSAEIDVTTEYTAETPDMEAISFQFNAWKGTFKVIKLAKEEAPAVKARSRASFQKHTLNIS